MGGGAFARRYGAGWAGDAWRAPAVMVGRQRERDVLNRLVARLDRGGAALVLLGEPGIGKTALLDYAADRVSHSRAVSVLRLRGVESEAVLPFAALADLLLPLRAHFGDLPSCQRISLEACLCLSGGAGDASGNPYVACVAALNVLASASEERPRLVAVDDLHWIDPSSVRVLLFVARHLSAERVTMVMSSRGEVAEMRPLGDLPVLEVARLSDAACAELLSQRGLEVAPWVLQDLSRLSRGNPLVLIEISSSLDTAQLRGEKAIPELLRIGGSLDRAWLARVDHLPQPTLDALTLLAASRSSAIRDLDPALLVLGLSIRALGPAEDIGLVSASRDHCEFRHPVLRPLILRRATLERRLRAFEALSQASSGALRAWYRAAAAPGLDDDIAGALAAAAMEARRRSAFDDASLAWHRAADLTTRPETRASFLHRAGEDAFLAGSCLQAVSYCDEALSVPHDLRMRADVELLRGRIFTWIGRPARAYEMLVAASRAVGSAHPECASRLLVEAALPAVIASQFADARGVAEEGVSLADASSRTARLVLGQVLVVTGRVPEGVDLIDRATGLLEAADPVHEAQMLTVTGQCYAIADRPETARGLLTRVVEAARHAAAPAALPYALAARSEVDTWAGRMTSAYSDASEAVVWAEELGQLSALGYALVCLARLDALRGDYSSCCERIARGEREVDRFEVRAMAAYLPCVAGFADFSRGEYAAAVGYLEQTYEIALQIGLTNPVTLPFAADLVEAHVRIGDRASAAEVLAWLDRCATSTRLAWPRAATSRCRGLLAESFTECRSHFEMATVAHRRRSTPFEHARTQLCQGEMFRKFRRSALARAPLRAALGTFRSLGAWLWAERAALELAAAGDRAAVPDQVELLDLLTPQELQVARAIVRGLNNHEVATALFVSRKTVEAHLTRVYRKLRVRSRTDLTRLLILAGVTD